MSKKSIVTAEYLGVIACEAVCMVCGWNSVTGENLENVIISQAQNHVRETGHAVSLIRESVTVFGIMHNRRQDECD